MIIKQFGGDIICKSKWQVGTSFIFLLPLDEIQNNSQLI
jgi:hypothetical protein